MGLFDAFSSSGGKEAANQAYQAQAMGLGLGRKELKAGKTESLGYLDQGIAPHQGLMDRGTQGIDYYGRLVGLQGPEAAQEAFQGSPGYQWQLDQGLEAINRRRNAAGMLNSGNADIDAIRFGTGLAQQDYYNMLNAVQPYFGLGQNAAGGVQSGFTNKANVARGTGQDLAQNWQALGQAGSDMAMNKYNAEQAASGNLWGSILGLGGAVTGAAGAAGGFGNLF